MAFITPDDSPRSVIFGADEGARTIFRARKRYPAGFFVGLHTHDGDESFEVREGKMRITVSDEQRVCEPGMVVIVPPGVRHGFVAETDAVVDIISEQKMGLYVVVIDPDGSERIEEIYMQNFPSSHDPPAGQDWTPREHIRAVYATTRHLLGPAFVGT